MRLNSSWRAATLAKTTGATILATAAVTMAAPAWAHHPHGHEHQLRQHAHQQQYPHGHEHHDASPRAAFDAPAIDAGQPLEEPLDPELLSAVASSAGQRVHVVLSTAQPVAAAANSDQSLDVQASADRSGAAMESPRSSSMLERVQERAMSLIGVRYHMGGTSPASGFDCSGFVQYVLRKAAGLQVSRTAASQATEGEHIDRGELRLGDLVFFHTLGRGISHVGLYLGHGEFVHAPSTGERVRVDNLNNPYWQVHYVTARRLGDISSRND